MHLKNIRFIKINFKVSNKNLIFLRILFNIFWWDMYEKSSTNEFLNWHIEGDINIKFNKCSNVQFNRKKTWIRELDKIFSLIELIIKSFIVE